MSLLDHNEQYDLAHRMEIGNEVECERQIREIATGYLERRNRMLADGTPGMLPPGGGHIVVQTGAQHAQFGPSAAYRAPTAMSPLLDAHYVDIKLDVAPGIDGFAAQIIAEEQIREQMMQVDTDR